MKIKHPKDHINLKNNIKLINNKVYIESFMATNSELDDTGRIQRAVDTASEYSEIIFDPKTEYSFTNIISTKSLDINFNGAKINVNLYPTNKPAFWFRGQAGTSYLLLSNVKEKDITISVNNASTLFSENDYIIIGDNKIVSSWNGSGFNYTGQTEINIVSSVSGNTVTLAKPLEWDYNLSNSAFVQKITNLIKSPKIKNVGNITEVNPGTTSPTSIAGSGHLFQFEYCILPQVENVIANKWQLHVVNFYRCIYGFSSKIQAYTPYRPQNGGHGYVVKFDNSWGGVASEITSTQARHVVDFLGLTIVFLKITLVTIHMV
jgi:hypothetical protein